MRSRTSGMSGRISSFRPAAVFCPTLKTRLPNLIASTVDGECSGPLSSAGTPVAGPCARASAVVLGGFPPFLPPFLPPLRTELPPRADLAIITPSPKVRTFDVRSKIDVNHQLRSTSTIRCCIARPQCCIATPRNNTKGRERPFAQRKTGESARRRSTVKKALRYFPWSVTVPVRVELRRLHDQCRRHSRNNRPECRRDSRNREGRGGNSECDQRRETQCAAEGFLQSVLQCRQNRKT